MDDAKPVDPTAEAEIKYDEKNELDHIKGRTSLAKLMAKLMANKQEVLTKEEHINAWLLLAEIFAHMQTPKRPMKCDLCGGEKIETAKDVGWDIWEGGEEKQHLDRCSACGATRFWCDMVEFGWMPNSNWGKWIPKTNDPNDPANLY